MHRQQTNLNNRAIIIEQQQQELTQQNNSTKEDDYTIASHRRMMAVSPNNTSSSMIVDDPPHQQCSPTEQVSKTKSKRVSFSENRKLRSGLEALSEQLSSLSCQAKECLDMDKK